MKKITGRLPRPKGENWLQRATKDGARLTALSPKDQAAAMCRLSSVR